MEIIRLRRRGRYSFELKTRYLLSESSDKHVHRLSIAFFLPYSFGITQETYPRVGFYRDLKLYLRFDTPRYRAREILESDGSPLLRLENMIERADVAGLDEGEFRYESKLLGSIYKSTLRDTIASLHSATADTDDDAAVEAETIKTLWEVPRRFHRLLRRMKEVIGAGGLVEHAKLIDEHLSLLLEKYVLDLEGEKSSALSRPLIEELEYRRSAGYPTADTVEMDRRALEEYVYREKMLKHYAGQVLFFQVRRRQRGRHVEEILYALAAGIAMVFATGVAFYGQTMFGGLSASLFILLVASYMLKDRMKDFFRQLFRRAIGPFFYDRNEALYDPRYGRRLAVVKERTYFATIDQLDPRIRAVRSRGPFEKALAGAADETLFVYDKKIRLRRRSIEWMRHRIRGVADISIVNLERLVRALAVPHGAVPMVKGDGRVEAKTVPRVYHLNVVAKFDAVSGTEVHRYRLIVTGKGIRRIESVR